MRYISKLTLVVVAVAAFGVAVAAGPAVAATNWSLVTAGAWHQAAVEVTKAVATKLKGTVTVLDTKEGITLECEVSGEGSVGPGTAGTETSVTFSKCATKTGTCGSPELVAVNLPWSMGEFGVNGGFVFATFKGVGTGAGYGLKCTILGIKVEDECVGSPKASFVNLHLGVESTFDTEGLRCNIPGENTGTFKGSVMIEAASGGKLETATVEKAVTSSHEVTLNSSKWDLVDESGPRIECALEAKGTVEASGKGTITSWSVNSCKWLTGSACQVLGSIKAVNMPWNTELLGTPPSSEEKIVSSGRGTPEWEIECSSGGIKLTDVCSLEITLKASSGGGVGLNTAYPPQKVNCSYGGRESGKWEGGILVNLIEPLPELALTS